MGIPGVPEEQLPLPGGEANVAGQLAAINVSLRYVVMELVRSRTSQEAMERRMQAVETELGGLSTWKAELVRSADERRKELRAWRFSLLTVLTGSAIGGLIAAVRFLSDLVARHATWHP